jgi:hypothetical protein
MSRVSSSIRSLWLDNLKVCRIGAHRQRQLPAVLTSRTYSTTVGDDIKFDHPAIQQLKDDLTVMQPCFGVRGDEIDVLFEPVDFHKRLLVSVTGADRIIE